MYLYLSIWKASLFHKIFKFESMLDLFGFEKWKNYLISWMGRHYLPRPPLPVQIGLKLHFVLFCCLRQNEHNFVLLFDKKPIGFVNKIWILLTKYEFFVLLFWYKIAKHFLILLVYWFFTFCSVLLFSRTGSCAQKLSNSYYQCWPFLFLLLALLK